MSDVVDRIAEVLRQHDVDTYFNDDGIGGSMCLGCDWIKQDATDAEVTAHVAERVAELFTEEWKMCHESGGGSIHHSYEEARSCFDSFVECPPGVDDPGSGKYTHIASRWVSNWSAVEEKS